MSSSAATLAAPQAPLAPLAPAASGEALHALVRRLYPLCRSITGDGVRQTLSILREYLPDLQVREVPTGTPVLDWEVPLEWNIQDAWIKNSRGERVVDFREHNLHVLGYSVPVAGWFSLAELRPHLYSLPEQPTLIPYRTAYYAHTWGFCLTHQQLLALEEDQYEVCIDSRLAPGSLTYGELLLPGELPEEVLISCHTCHPSLANDNLSALAVATFLAQHLAQAPRRYSYRFVFAPGTIGAIAWLALHPQVVARIRHGLVLSLLGDAGPFTYKKSRRGTAEVDRAVALALREAAVPHALTEFSPYGYDERQYCSPGFNLPVGCLSRTPYGQFSEYHTSADNLAFVQPEALFDSLHLTQAVLAVLDANCRYQNLSPYGEPALGRRGLYSTVGGQPQPPSWQLALLWVLNLSDGQHSLLDIAERASLPFEQVRHAADALLANDLLARLAD
jgi:aminopeptidase-like protein